MPHAEGTWLHADGDTLEVLAEPGSGRAELYALAAREKLSPLHSEAAMAEAAELVAEPGIANPDLADFTHLPFVTIDEVYSKDLDQAVAIERCGDGFTVWYALADASYYIRPGMALYDEALARGASYYLPGLVIPMLPAVLSEDIISLNPRVDRRAMVFELELDAAGRSVATRIHRARVHCREKLAFDGVQAFLDGAEVSWSEPVCASLKLLPEVGHRRMRLAEERSVVRYRRAEVDVRLQGHRFVALDEPRNDVERFNEQISLLTNIQGALHLLDRGDPQPHIQPIFRVHDAPGAERFEDFRAATASIAALHGLDPEIWVWRPDAEELGVYLDRLPFGPISRAIHRQAMVANRPSHYAAEPGRHYGVGAEVYGRFTAPMREIVGVFLHNEVWEKAAGEPAPVPSGFEGEGLRERVLTSANASRQRQRKLDRDANRLVLDHLFEAPDAGGPATVLGITPSRVHVQLDQPRIDVKVYRRHLEDAWDTELKLGDAGCAMRDSEGVQRVRIGDRGSVHVAGRDAQHDRWRLVFEPER